MTSNIGAFGLGTTLGYTSPAVPDLKERILNGTVEIDMFSEGTESWIGSVFNLGAIASVIVVGILVDIIGRKMSMILLSVPFVLGWLLIAFAQNSVMIISGRAITGFCGGGFSLVSPLFVAEMAEDNIRGALGSGFQIMLTFGILFVSVVPYVFGSFLSYKWLAIVCCFVPIISLVAMIFIPESPRYGFNQLQLKRLVYLVFKGKLAEAGKSLCWFRKKASFRDVEVEMRIIEMSVHEMKSQASSFGELFESHHLRPSLLMMALMCFLQLSGINAVIFYTYDIFQAAGTTMDENLSTIIFGSVQFGATVSTIFFVDRAGRKILLLVSSAVMCGSLVVLGIFFHLKENGNDEGLGLLPLICLMLFTWAFSIGYGPIPWVMLGELIPQKVKARVASLATVISWSLSFVVTKFFKSIQDTLTIQWCYWIFAIICAIGFAFVFLLLPETKGKSVEEIQNYFSDTRLASVSPKTE
ncbi:Facilitated trehalose transporter Tret1 [Orchesella cincta]|uniref:Facilitated trehalose transporter Tret1 n=1 Tax=Orchesella cincta TaxID=48709 RepID=A0A1D2M5K0_ORCCI|nr:Facilitated trehalose transporter Tret1 [Orchesella cincta]